MRARGAGFVGLAAASAVAVAGCSSGHSTSQGAGSTASPSQGKVVLAAYQHTVDQKTAKISLNESVAASGGQAGSGGSAAITANGVVDFASKAADLTPTVHGQQLELREIGPDLFVHFPAAVAKQVPGGKPWISMNLAKISQAKLGTSLSSLTQTSQANPSQMLGYLQAVSASGVHKAGTTTIRGTQTTEYDATVDLQKLAAHENSPAAQQAVKRLEAQMGASGYPIKVWIDSGGLVRQLQFAISAHPSPAGGNPSAAPTAVAVTATLQFYDYGTQVSVSAPPADQTTDLTNQIATSSP
jgi:hypothetical protein